MGWWLFVLLVLVCYIVVNTYRKVTQKSMKREIVLVTGGGSGLGRLLSLKFASLGSTIVVVDISKEGGEETVRQIKREGGTAHSYTCDITDWDRVKELSDSVKDEVGDVTVLINNAGIAFGKRLFEISSVKFRVERKFEVALTQTREAMFRKTLEVNTISNFFTVRCFLPKMIERSEGHVVTVASAAGIVGVAGLADYCASKFGAFGFHESVRMELRKMKKFGIDTTIVCPYYINTGMFEGVKTRFPFLLPILDQDYVANEIVNAVRMRKEMVILPKLVYVAYIARLLFPTRFNDFLFELLGVSDSMDEFKGRAQANKKQL